MQASKTIPASQVKNNFGAIVSQVQRGVYPEVIVENRGEPIVAIVPLEDLKAMKEFREQERQKEALEKLRSIRARIQARIKGKLTDKETEKIADRINHELVEDLEKAGKIKFEKRTS